MDIHASAMLTVSEARLASVLDTAATGIVVIDEKGRILVFNKACENLFGYRAAEVIGKNVKVIMPSRYSDAHDRYLTNYLGTGVKKIIGIGREVEGRHRSGEVIPVELAVGEADTPAGRQFIGIIRDLRQQRKDEERIDALQSQLVHMARVSAMDEMGAALAHELNQPLTAAMLYMQAARRALARDGEPAVGADALSEILDKATRETERAGKIIQRMRNFVEKRETARQRHDLSRLVDEAVDFAMVGMRARDVAVRRSHAETVPPVHVDPVQIQQIVVNLLRNAFEAVRDAELREIRVETGREGERVTFSIEDSGPGVPRAVLPELFKAFSTSKKSGMGLGLAISKTIAQSHGGDLVVDPGGAGRGARFCLYLPAGTAEEADERTS